VNPPEGGRPISVTAASPKAKAVIGIARAMPVSPSIRSWPAARRKSPAARNIAALAAAWETAWKTPPAQAPADHGWGASAAPASGKTRKR
jgi:hypothetical protein